MSLMELQQAVDAATLPERQALAAYLHHLSRRDDLNYRAEMEAAATEVRRGTFPLTEVKRRHTTQRA